MVVVALVTGGFTGFAATEWPRRVMIWSMVGLVGALAFEDIGANNRWLALYICLTIVSGVIEASTEAPIPIIGHCDDAYPSEGIRGKRRAEIIQKRRLRTVGYLSGAGFTRTVVLRYLPQGTYMKQ